MIDIAIPAIMIFLAGDLFGVLTMMLLDWYYEKKKKEVNRDSK